MDLNTESLIDKYRGRTWFIMIRRNIMVRLFRRSFYELRTLVYVLQNSLLVNFYQRIRGSSAGPIRQSFLSWDVELSRVLGNGEDLKSLLKEKDISFNEGGNVIYIPPQSRSRLLFGEMASFYPSDAGFKILKHFQPPVRASYVDHCRYGSKGDCYLRRILTGSINDQMDAANVLHMFELAPALYDIAEITANGVQMTCFVVQHVAGASPSEEEYESFIRKLKMLIEHGILTLVPAEGLRFMDFKGPDCNGNLIKSNEMGKLMYIDFQQFIVRDKRKMLGQILSEGTKELHFGNSRLFRAKQYLYQAIPGTSIIGKRGTDKRWSLIMNILRSLGIKISGRVVLDIGCNAGMMLSCALSDGAIWGLGWDLPNVIKHATRLNRLIGSTRLDLYGAKLSEAYPLSKDIPSRLKALLGGCVVFYLSIWRHIGFMSDLARIPWRVLIFEGHNGDTFENLETQLRKVQLEWNCTVAIKSEIRDGDCGRRPIVVFERGNAP